MGRKLCVGWGWGEIKELLGEETYNKVGTRWIEQICSLGLDLHEMYSTVFTPDPKLQFPTKEAFCAAGRKTRLSLCIQKKT